MTISLSFFMTLIVLRSTSHVFCRIFHIWDLTDVFLIIRLRLYIFFGGETIEVKCNSCHIKGTYCQHGLLLTLIS